MSLASLNLVLVTRTGLFSGAGRPPPRAAQGRAVAAAAWAPPDPGSP